MSWHDFFAQQREGMSHMAGVGVIGLHMASGPIVGFAIGYGLDLWLPIAPWGKIGFLLVGIGAGFLNVWRDSKELLKKMDKVPARQIKKDGSAPE